MKFKSKKRSFGLLAIGLHIVEIISAVFEEKASKDNAWADTTPQLNITYKGEKGTISAWYNLKGFKKASDPDINGQAPKGHEFRSSVVGNEEYLVNIATNERVESESATEKCLEIMAGVGADAGIPEDDDFETDDLQNKELIIVVRESQNGKNVEVHYTKALDAEVEAETKEEVAYNNV